jgi:hypothetical protein
MITQFSALTCISIQDILGNSREENICDARHVYWCLLYQAGYSLSVIARLNDRKHSSVLHGINRIKHLKDSDKRIRRIYEQTSGLIATIRISKRPDAPQAQTAGAEFACPQQTNSNHCVNVTCSNCGHEYCVRCEIYVCPVCGSKYNG